MEKQEEMPALKDGSVHETAWTHATRVTFSLHWTVGWTKKAI